MKKATIITTIAFPLAAIFLNGCAITKTKKVVGADIPSNKDNIETCMMNAKTHYTDKFLQKITDDYKAAAAPTYSYEDIRMAVHTSYYNHALAECTKNPRAFLRITSSQDCKIVPPASIVCEAESPIPFAPYEKPMRKNANAEAQNTL